jgi:hypothetical protein
VTTEEKIKATTDERSIFMNVGEGLKECDQNECKCRLWPLARGNTGGEEKSWMESLMPAWHYIYMVALSRA